MVSPVAADIRAKNSYRNTQKWLYWINTSLYAYYDMTTIQKDSIYDVHKNLHSGFIEYCQHPHAIDIERYIFH